MTDDWKGRGVALFDMDGTLLPWDTQYVFSCFVVRLHPWRRLLIVLFLACIPFYVLKIWDEKRMKRAYLMYLWGLPAETVREYGRKFARMAQEWIYPELKERLEEDRKKFEQERQILIEEAREQQATGQATGEGSFTAVQLLFRGVNNPLALRKRYRDLIKIFHPDNLFGDGELAGQINKEYLKRKQEERFW